MKGLRKFDIKGEIFEGVDVIYNYNGVDLYLVESCEWGDLIPLKIVEQSRTDLNKYRVIEEEFYDSLLEYINENIY